MLSLLTFITWLRCLPGLPTAELVTFLFSLSIFCSLEVSQSVHPHLKKRGGINPHLLEEEVLQRSKYATLKYATLAYGLFLAKGILDLINAVRSLSRTFLISD